MKIAFYAPLKSPNHPVPSGDRLMARQLVTALGMAGHAVDLVSELRSYQPSAENDGAERQAQADAEVARISGLWQAEGKPDLFFCYHPYYKSPDLIGPPLCREFGIRYVTAEASYSQRRNIANWTAAQHLVVDCIGQAAANICFTERDLRGLARVAPNARLERLLPFIDPAPYLVHDPAPEPGHLLTMAMMRPGGNKVRSYRALATALSRLLHLPWRLTIVGDGEARPEVEAMFSGPVSDRVQWLGLKPREEIAALLPTASIFVWPGQDEAYGLSYLEAQAAGLPIVAEASGGVPEVVRADHSGLLTEPGNVHAYANSIATLLTDEGERQRLANNARRFVIEERSLAAAAGELDHILSNLGTAR